MATTGGPEPGRLQRKWLRLMSRWWTRPDRLSTTKPTLKEAEGGVGKVSCNDVI